MRFALCLSAAFFVTACTAPDQPASPERLGRFMGLVAQCGCSDVTPNRMLAEYGRAVAGRYSEAELRRMKGFVELGATERFNNQIPICAEICSQTCQVNAVVKPLGGKVRGNGATCPLTERDLNLTTGWTDTE
ncbi:MAG: hypothetical protein H7Y60_10615 [Rhodospirillaceae bacterium]|nr:hypothetical protein [Rhodospirillales bacterium]